MQKAGRQFSTYLRGEVAEPFEKMAEAEGVTAYALLAKAAEEYLRSKGALPPKQKLDMGHRVPGRVRRRRVRSPK